MTTDYNQFNFPDAPLEPEDIEFPRCPCCNEECEDIYVRDDTREIIGCNCCTDYKWADEVDIEFCPECGSPCDLVYSKDGQIVGCDRCISEEDAWEWVP